MTQIQKNQFETMLAQALINNIHIAAKGTIKATGQTFYAVSSSNGVDCYAVLVDGTNLTCNCRAAQCGKYCSHRALVRAHIIDSAPKAAPVVAPVASNERVTIRNTPSLASVLQSMRPLTPRAQEAW